MTEIFDERLPLFLRQSLSDVYSEEDCRRIAEGYGSNRRSAFRVNRLKCGTDAALEAVKTAGAEAKALEWFEDGFVCLPDDDRKLRETTLYENGEIYLQNPSSMLPPVLLGPEQGQDILDMCAAPGGKTTQLASMTMGKCGIMACESDKTRAQKLSYNLNRQGARASVHVGDARKLDGFFRFDRILLDAPCSGSGTMLTEREQSYRAFSEALVKNCSKLQFQLLKKAVSMLKKDGEMVYSTCSILPKENEDVVREILKTGAVEVVPCTERFRDVPTLPCSIEGALLVCPTEVYEGFFAVKLRKKN